MGTLSASSNLQHPKVLIKPPVRAVLPPRAEGTLHLLAVHASLPHFGLATPSIILILVVLVAEGTGPCSPACICQFPAPPPLSTFPCTHSRTPSGDPLYFSDPCLSLRLYEMGEPPSVSFGFRLVHMNKYFYFVSLAHHRRLGTQETGFFWRDEKFRHFLLHT